MGDDKRNKQEYHEYGNKETFDIGTSLAYLWKGRHVHGSAVCHRSSLQGDKQVLVARVINKRFMQHS
jgi:hypothetical protein